MLFRSLSFSTAFKRRSSSHLLDQIKDRDAVADRADDRVAVRSKEDVALAVDGSCEVGEAVGHGWAGVEEEKRVEEVGRAEEEEVQGAASGGMGCGNWPLTSKRCGSGC